MTLEVSQNKFQPEKGIEPSGIPYHFEPVEWDLSDTGILGVEQGAKTLSELTSKFIITRTSLEANIISGDIFLAALGEYQNLFLAYYRFRGFLKYKNSEDTSNPEFRSDTPLARAALEPAATELALFKQWVRDLPTETAALLIELAPSELRYYLSHLREQDPNKLVVSDIQRLERLNTEARGHSEKYSALVGALEFKVPWSEQPLNAADLGGSRYSADAFVREAAYRELLSGYGKLAEPLIDCLRSVVLNWDQQSRVIRGYKRPDTYINEKVEGLSDLAIDNLLSTSQKNEDILREFVKLKAQALGLSRLSRFDLYTAIGASADPIPYSEGIKIVLDALYHFDPDWARMASEVLQKRHMNSLNGGKREFGAYCESYGPGVLPFLFTNYDGSLNCLLGYVAHELGHAIHFILSNGQPALAQDTGTLISEVASTLAEKITLDYLLEKYPERRLELLNAELVGVYQTIFRQALFGRFEKAVHGLVLDGGTTEQVLDLYYNCVKEQFGPDIEVDPCFRNECLMVKHFYGAVDRLFYCTSYNGADLLSRVKYARCKSDGPEFTEKLKRMLSLGGSRSQLELAAICDIDLNSENFAQRGFAQVREKLEQFRAEVDKLSLLR